MTRDLVRLLVRAMPVGFVALIALAGCAGPAPSPARASAEPSLPRAIASPPAATQVLAATASPDEVASCIRHGGAAFPGVVERRPPGWSNIGEIATVDEFPHTFGSVYGPAGATAPPNEGPGRIVLYETMPGDDVYLTRRIDRSRRSHGTPIALAVCGQRTNVWLDEATGELLVGWVDRDKTDVLVANTADLTIQQLIEAAERVSDCCG
jgi:hypothetical protein